MAFIISINTTENTEYTKIIFTIFGLHMNFLQILKFQYYFLEVHSYLRKCHRLLPLAPIGVAHRNRVARLPEWLTAAP